MIKTNHKICLIHLVIGLTVLSACVSPKSNLSKDEAVRLLNEGQVTEMGVTHGGWNILTLKDGTFVGGRAVVIGYPDELLDLCAECSYVVQWME